MNLFLVPPHNARIPLTPFVSDVHAEHLHNAVSNGTPSILVDFSREPFYAGLQKLRRGYIETSLKQSLLRGFAPDEVCNVFEILNCSPV